MKMSTGFFFRGVPAAAALEPGGGDLVGEPEGEAAAGFRAVDVSALCFGGAAVVEVVLPLPVAAELRRRAGWGVAPCLLESRPVDFLAAGDRSGDSLGRGALVRPFFGFGGG